MASLVPIAFATLAGNPAAATINAMGPSKGIVSTSMKINGPKQNPTKAASSIAMGPSLGIDSTSQKVNGPKKSHRQHLVELWQQACS
jgi:hypothetical protein